MARSRWNRRERLIASTGAGDHKLSLVLTVRDPILIDGDQYELVLMAHGVTILHETIIGRTAAMARYTEVVPQVAVLIAKKALQL